MENLKVSNAPASVGGMETSTQNLDEFDILNLADMALARRQRLFDAEGMSLPDNELKDAVKISMLLDAADEWGVRQAEDPDGFRREVVETVALARQYFTVEGGQ